MGSSDVILAAYDYCYYSTSVLQLCIALIWLLSMSSTAVLYNWSLLFAFISSMVFKHNSLAVLKIGNLHSALFLAKFLYTVEFYMWVVQSCLTYYSAPYSPTFAGYTSCYCNYGSISFVFVCSTYYGYRSCFTNIFSVDKSYTWHLST